MIPSQITIYHGKYSYKPIIYGSLIVQIRSEISSLLPFQWHTTAYGAKKKACDLNGSKLFF
jgi:hypothetical protein